MSKSTAHLWKALPLGGLALQLAGCALFPPLIDTELLARPQREIRRVAVMHLYPKPGLAHTTSQTGLPAWEAAASVTRFLEQALAERGVAAIPLSEAEATLFNSLRAPSGAEVEAAAAAVADDFDADALLVGEVARYRERAGGDRGAFASASVAFELTLYEAPSGRRLWKAHFDQTQSSFTSNPLTAHRYPGRGTRFLTAAELARWGAALAAEAMPLAQPAPD